VSKGRLGERGDLMNCPECKKDLREMGISAYDNNAVIGWNVIYQGANGEIAWEQDEVNDSPESEFDFYCGSCGARLEIKSVEEGFK